MKKPQPIVEEDSSEISIPDSTTTPINDDSGNMVFEIVLDGSPQRSDLLPTEIKYGKKGWISGEWDDNSPAAMEAQRILTDFFYTDGCGNKTNYAFAVAVNGRNGYHNGELGLENGIVNYDSMRLLIQHGWDIENHSYYHGPDGNYNFGYDWDKNIEELDNLIAEKIHYQMNGAVVPTDYKNFPTAAKNFGYLFSSSQGTFDGLPPGGTPDWSAKNELFSRAPKDFSAFGRMFYDNWNEMEKDFTQKLNNIVGTSGTFFRIGSHGIDGDIFRRMMVNFQNKTADDFIVVPTREIMEYRIVADQPVEWSVEENKINVTVDISGIPDRFRWRDISFLFSSDQTIRQINVIKNIDRVSFNAETGLINIFNQRTTWD